MTPPVTTPPTKDPLLEAAARWKALLESGELSDAEQLEYDSWQPENTRHTAALNFVNAKVASVCNAIGDQRAAATIGLRLDTPAASHARPLVIASSKRRERLGAGSQTFRTERGDVGELLADDGSLIRLMPASEIKATFEEGVRTISLLQGGIFASRPHSAPGSLLVVPAETGGVVRVLPGAEATVEMRGREALCTTAAGRCVVITDDNDVAVDAGSGMSFNRHAGRIEAIDFEEVFDWVEDKLTANSRTVLSVIDRMRPLSRIPIVVEKSLESLTVDGEFSPLNTEASLRRIAEYLHTTFHCRPDQYMLGHPDR